MSTRTLLILLLVFLGTMIYVEWRNDYATTPSAAEAPSEEFAPASESEPPREPAVDLPDLPELTEEAPAQPGGESERPASREQIEVRTDTLAVQIDPVGGTITDVRLLKYPVSLDEPDVPFVLMHDDPSETYIAQSGLLAGDQPAPNHASLFSYERGRYELREGADTLEVPLVWEGDGLRVTKTLRFHRDEYQVDVVHTVENRGTTPWRGGRYLQLQRTQPPEGNGPAFTNPERFSFVGGMIYSPEDKDEKVSLKDFGEKPYSGTFAGGWEAMLQHYFFTAWIPPAEQQHRYTTRVDTSGAAPRYVLSAVSPQQVVQAGETGEFQARFYAGPKLQGELEAIAPGLSLTVNYRIFTILSKPLFWLLDKIHSLLGNWGWAIIVLTLLIKLAFYKLTQTQYRSMAKMRKLTPRIQALKERYGDDRQKFSQKMMEIYRTEKVNPLGGCLPILVQIPIFISLYWVLLESVELRQSSFLWVPDLSRPDPFFILPIVNGVAMIVTQRLMPTPGVDPMQRRVMQALPVVFAFLFALFPAGLVLYWATNTVISLAQQWWITRQIERAA